jgi:hypothetical protein
VIAGHGDQCEDFQLIARKPLEKLCFHMKNPFSEVIDFLSV